MSTSPHFASTSRLPARRPARFAARNLNRRRIHVFLAAGLFMLAGCVDEPVPTEPSSPRPEVGPSASRASIAAALRSSEIQAVLRAKVRGVSIDLSALENHEMLPANVIGIESDEGLDENEPDARVRALIAQASQRLAGPEAAVIKSEIAAMPGQPLPTGPAYGVPPDPFLDVNDFGEAFHAAIKDSVAGYALRIIQNGQLIYTLQWPWAQTPADGSLGWNANRRMHVASISKLITAAAMVRTLQKNGVDYDAKIIDYLPIYWQKGSNIGNISFRHLLTHTSGFSTGSSSSSYPFMKAQVAAGVSGVGSYDYENMNFGLQRILIPIINGYIDKDTEFPCEPGLPTCTLNDLLWDAVATSIYVQYVEQKVFAPAGVSGPTLDKPVSPALAYPFPAVGNGWNSGNHASRAGGVGWHMSINEVLRVMHAFRRAGHIVPPSEAQEALDAGFGIDRIINTDAGKLYDKNGRWRSGSRTEQSVATFMPDGLNIVVFVNSPIGVSGASLRNLVRDLYIANIVEP